MTPQSNAWREHLLRRYGVVFRRVLERERCIPTWRALLHVYRRLEARGEVRGGRFVDGYPGEHFALPEAVTALRKTRREQPDHAWIVVHSADPTNLVGIVGPGEKISAHADNRVLYRDGVAVAVRTSQQVAWLAELDEHDRWHATTLLTRGPHARHALTSAPAMPRLHVRERRP